MIVKAVQQLMLGRVLPSEGEALAVLKAIKLSGYKAELSP